MAIALRSISLEATEGYSADRVLRDIVARLAAQQGVALARIWLAIGRIAPGAGPVFIGNDASGREMAGIVDDIWLNTLAAPASAIQALTCIRSAPTVALAPATTPPENAGTPVPFDLAITNTNGSLCPPDIFDVLQLTGYPLTFVTPIPTTVAPGQTVHLSVQVSSSKSTAVGSYPFALGVVDESGPNATAEAQGVYVVGTGPISCDGTPLQSPAITGILPSPIGNTPGDIYSYAAPGLNGPVVTLLYNSDGSTSAFQVSANPGTSNDLNAAYSGFGSGFRGCTDASAYTGIQFTISGDLGTCSLELELADSENNSYSPPGVCTAGVDHCYGPFSPPLVVGTNVVNFADMTGGSPVAALDSSALNDIGWQLNVPTDGVTAPCVASFTITDVSFVAAPSSSPASDGGAGSGGHRAAGAAGGTP